MQALRATHPLDRSAELTAKNPLYSSCLQDYLVSAVLRDLGLPPDHAPDFSRDVTTSSLFPGGLATGSILAKEAGVLAGMEEAAFLCAHFGIRWRPQRDDGAQLAEGDAAGELSGSLPAVLAVERRLLELLRRMSGIATETALVRRELEGTKTLVAATRKCPWELLDKKAVAVGGGLTHRLSLHDAVLVKDNHLAALRGSSLRDSLARARGAFIELEVTSRDDALQASRLFQELALRTPCILLLDNFSPAQVRETVGLLRSEGTLPLIEASGGITREHARAYAQAGADVISLGYLTHSARSLDLSLEVQHG